MSWNWFGLLKCTDGFCLDAEQCIAEYFLLEKIQDCYQGSNGTKPSKSKQKHLAWLFYCNERIRFPHIGGKLLPLKC